MSDRPEAGHPRILLVEDEDIVREVIEDTLMSSGFTVVSASDARDALEVIGSEDPVSLVVTDHSLPGLTGSELARRIRSMRPDLPILLVSGYAIDADLSAEGIPHLTKPFMPDTLLARIRQLLTDEDKAG